MTSKAVQRKYSNPFVEALDTARKAVHTPTPEQQAAWLRGKSIKVGAGISGAHYCPRGYDECQQGCAYPGRCRVLLSKVSP